ncbi:unnamed protein product [Chrysodeixis includens]|uniref:Uncharacterized protein n=1 Tax=Chrysodeixis includens TaxID=689277 RepID=A0A9N8PXX3_CHRIL|nr:unnamed protein product [Chrysodeixis includens]
MRLYQWSAAAASWLARWWRARPAAASARSVAPAPLALRISDQRATAPLSADASPLRSRASARSCAAMRSAGSRCVAAASCSAALRQADAAGLGGGAGPELGGADAARAAASAPVTRAAHAYGLSRDAASLRAKASALLPS